MKSKSPTLLIVGHGSSISKGAEEAARKHAGTLRKRDKFKKVLVHFLVGDQSLPEIPDGEVFLFPFFMTGGYIVETKLPALFKSDHLQDDRPRSQIHQCVAMGVHKFLAHILKKMALEVCDRYAYETNEVQVVLFAHGSGKSDSSKQTTKVQKDRLREISDFACVTSVFLEQEPSLQSWLDENTSDDRPIIILGFFAADGPHSAIDVPLAITKWETQRKSLECGELPTIHYAGAVGTRGEIVELIQQSVADKINLL